VTPLDEERRRSSGTEKRGDSAPRSTATGRARPPPPTEKKKNKNAFLRRRAATRFSAPAFLSAGADASRCQLVRGGGGTGVDVENGEANICDASSPFFEKNRDVEAVPARGPQTLWAPGSVACVQAWGAARVPRPRLAARSSASASSSASSSGSRACSARDPFEVVPIPSQKLGQRTALAIDALRSTRRRAWSADASPYAASLAGTGTLPPARGAKKAFSFVKLSDDVKRDVKKRAADERRSFDGTRLETLEKSPGSVRTNARTNARLRRVSRVSRENAKASPRTGNGGARRWKRNATRRARKSPRETPPSRR
jgi:hypothetical protein